MFKCLNDCVIIMDTIFSQSKGSKGFMEPQKIVDSLDIEKGNTVVDFGAGAGYFAIPLAKKVIPKGRVVAVDIMPNSLDIIKKKSLEENLTNMEFLQADLEVEKSTNLAGASADFVIIVNVLFQIKNKANVFREAKRILKPGGKFIVIDWTPGRTVMGPRDTERVSMDQVRIASVINGFKEIKTWLPDAYHYGFIFVK